MGVVAQPLERGQRHFLLKYGRFAGQIFAVRLSLLFFIVLFIAVVLKQTEKLRHARLFIAFIAWPLLLFHFAVLSYPAFAFPEFGSQA